MSEGVKLNSINVHDTVDGKCIVEVSLSIAADNEFEAVGWLVYRLDESS